MAFLRLRDSALPGIELRRLRSGRRQTGTKVAAANATPSDVGERAAFERLQGAGGLRVAQEEWALWCVLYC